MNIADISDQAWQKRIIKSVPWLHHIATSTISKLSQKSKKPFCGSRTFKLVDGTIIRQGGTGKRINRKNQPIGGGTIRVHMCYNLTEGHMEEVSVTDNHTAESVKIFNISHGDIYIADANYGRGKNIEHIASCGADAIFRATPNQLNLAKDIKGKSKIDMVQRLDTNADIVEFSCFIHSENMRYVPVRVIASRLPKEQAALARERKLRKAKKSQTKNVKPQTLIYAGWVILITTLGGEYDAQTILAWYRTRWQVELLFKRIKQSFNISKLPSASLEHSKAVVLLWLILWATTEQYAVETEVYLMNNDIDMTLYSPWAIQQFLFQQIKSIICCLSALLFDPQLHALNIFQRLRNHRSSRYNQFSTFRFGNNSSTDE